MLLKLDEAAALVRTGKPLLVAGGAELLRRLPRVNWIGGTTPFVLAGRVPDSWQREFMLVTSLPEQASLRGLQRYGMGGLGMIPADTPEDGFCIVIMPYGSLVHHCFAKEAPSYPGIYAKAVSGWVSGVAGNVFGERPQVFFGPNARCIEDEAVVMHVGLAPGWRADVEIVNVFEPGDGPAITFPSEGFTATHANVGGRTMLFSEYLRSIGTDGMSPLVADYCGIRVNVSFRSIDEGQVHFFAPVFRNVEYRMAAPIPNIRETIRDSMPKGPFISAFNCLCMGNFRLGMMDGLVDDVPEGPVAFGEISHIVLNQSFTCLRILPRGGG